MLFLFSTNFDRGIKQNHVDPNEWLAMLRASLLLYLIPTYYNAFHDIRKQMTRFRCAEVGYILVYSTQPMFIY